METKWSHLFLGCCLGLAFMVASCDLANEPTVTPSPLPTDTPPQPAATREHTPASTKPGDQEGFTGEILPVFYVSDVRKSVQFYKDVLGFEFHHYWDYDKNEPVLEWTDAEPPIYAEMAAGDQKFALHLAQTPYETQVGGVIHYFRVQDVSAHHLQVKSQGGEPDRLISRLWMNMFSIVDPDGHKIFFYTPPDG